MSVTMDSFLYRYGISYHGASQAASGTKEQVSQARAKTAELFKKNDRTNRNIDVNSETQSPGESYSSNNLRFKTSQPAAVSTFPSPPEKQQKDDDDLEYDEEDPDYEDEEYLVDKTDIDTPKSLNLKKATVPEKSKTFTQTTPTQTQQAAIPDKSKNYRIVQTQNGKSIYQEQKPSSAATIPATTTPKSVPSLKSSQPKSVPTPSTTTTTRTTTSTEIPDGFNKIDETPAKISYEKQQQSQKYPTRFLQSKYSDKKLSTDSSQPKPNPDSYVTVTKSVTGSIDDTNKSTNESKNFASTYYTKSSTCGYFTFSCNIVYGSNGKSKVCRPKAPTNGKC